MTNRLKKKTQSTAKYYNDFFVAQMNAGVTVKNSDGDILTVQETEVFKQCYKKGHPVRKHFPKYWFCSNRGNLISVCGKKLLWIKRSENNSYGRYAFTNANGECSGVQGQNLVGLTFDSPCYGSVERQFKKYGDKAFGRRKDKKNGNGHHIRKLVQNPELLYDPENIQFITAQVHELVTKSGKKRDFQKEMEYMKELAEVAAKEEPGKATIEFTGVCIDRKTGAVTHGNEQMIAAVDLKKISDRVNEFLRNARIIAVEISPDCVAGSNGEQK